MSDWLWAPWWAVGLNAWLAWQLRAYVARFDGLDQPWRLPRVEQVDHRLAEPEDDRVLVLEHDRQAEHLLVEATRLGEILDEQCDRRDARCPSLSHAHSLFARSVRRSIAE